MTIRAHLLKFLFFINVIEDGTTPERISWTKVGILMATLANVGTGLAVFGDQMAHFFVSTPDHISPFTLLVTSVPHSIAAMKDEWKRKTKFNHEIALKSLPKQ